MKYLMIILAVITFTASNSYSQFRLSLQGGLNFPLGDFADLAATGYGITATGELVQSKSLSFTIGLGYNHWSAKSNLPLGWDYQRTSVPLTGGIRYYFANEGILPYAGVEIGMYFNSSKETSLFGEVPASSSNSAINLGIIPQLGVKFALTPSINIDANMKYHIVTNSGFAINYFAINAGLQF